MLDILDQDFLSTISNMLQEIKETMDTKLKEAMKMMYTTTINIYTHNSRSPKIYEAKTGTIEGENSSTIIVGRFNSLL